MRKRPSPTVRALIVTVTACAALAGLAGTALAAEPRTGAEAQAEQRFFALANSSRSQAGMAAMGGHGGWQAHARDHSVQMAGSSAIFHDSNLGGEASTLGCWDRVGENVGRGPNVDAIHTALMNSPSHRANLLGDFDALGVGVEIAADGTVYVTQRFLKNCAAAVPTPAPEPAPPPQIGRRLPAPVAPRPAPAGGAQSGEEAPPKISTDAAPAFPLLEPLQKDGQERLGGMSKLDVGV